PASRSPWKWTPFTTRPRSTSRHGMMRFVSMKAGAAAGNGDGSYRTARGRGGEAAGGKTRTGRPGSGGPVGTVNGFGYTARPAAAQSMYDTRSCSTRRSRDFVVRLSFQV